MYLKIRMKKKNRKNDTENLVKKLIKDKLDIQEDVDTERRHRLNHKKRNNPGGKPNDEKPRSIVAKFASWKVKERVVKKAREVRPNNIKFVADLSQKTFDKRDARLMT